MFTIVYLYSTIMGLVFKYVIKSWNLIEELRGFNLIVVENYVRSTTFTVNVIVTL